MSEKKPFYREYVFYSTLAIGIIALTGLFNFLETHNIFGKDNSKQKSPTNVQREDMKIDRNTYPSTIDKEIRIGGSTSFADINFDPEVEKRNNKEIQRYNWFKNKGLELKYQEPSGANRGSKTGFKMLLDNKIDVLQSSESFKDKDELNTNKFKEQQVASDAIVFYVSNHSKSGFSSLTITQLKGILTGTIPNWNQEKTSKINVYSREIKVSGTVEYVSQKIMKGEKFKEGTIIKEKPTDAIKSVSDDPTGIGFATAGEVCSQQGVRVLSINNVNPCTSDPGTNNVNLPVLENGTYSEKLIRPLYVIYKTSGVSKKAGDAYVSQLRSDEGKEFVKKAGMIPY
jgi:ABC-type phosphate transport system substrate-binding protein